MDHIQILGLVAGAATTLSLFPQAIKVHRTKHTGDLSLMMFVIFVFGVCLWLAYGLLRNDVPVIAANSVTIVLATYILLMKIKHG